MILKDRKEVYILGFARTPHGTFLGALSSFSAPKLGSFAIKAAIERSNIYPNLVDDVLMGNVLQAGIGQAPARQAALKAGIPENIQAVTINKVCASGLEAIILGAIKIKAGEETSCVIAGGMESMSNAPYLSTDFRKGKKMGDGKILDSIIKDGLWCFRENWHMGNAAEFIARQRGITRDQMDRFSFESHMRAIEADYRGYFLKEIIPIDNLDKDETPKRNTSLEKIKKLKSAFSEEGNITAGNAPGLTDGASALVLANKEFVKKNKLNPIAKIITYTQVANDPKWLFEAPELAIKKLLDKTQTKIVDYDLFEINEAFAAQILANINALKLDKNILNIYGGAIALGHPIGSSGARIVVTLVNALEQNGFKRGIATLCHGGGGALAISIERI